VEEHDPKRFKISGRELQIAHIGGTRRSRGFVEAGGIYDLLSIGEDALGTPMGGSPYEEACTGLIMISNYLTRMPGERTHSS